MAMILQSRLIIFYREVNIKVMKLQMAYYNIIASIIYLPCGIYAVHRSWMTEFNVAMHNYLGVNHVCMVPCLNLKCPGDIISTQVIARVSVYEQSNR